MPTQVLDHAQGHAQDDAQGHTQSHTPDHDRPASVVVDRGWILEAIHRGGADRALNVVGLRECVRLAVRVDDRSEVTVMLCQEDTVPAGRAVAAALDDFLHAGGCRRWRVELAVHEAPPGAEILLAGWHGATS